MIVLETESSVAEVQFVIDSCCLVIQSNYLNNSNKDCDWLIFREYTLADETFPRLKNKAWFKNIGLLCRGNKWTLIIKQIKKSQLCSVLL